MTQANSQGWYGTNYAMSLYYPYSKPASDFQYPQQYSMNTQCAVGSTQEEKELDKVIRSRNALIIALIVFVAGFLACLIAVFVLKYPPPSLSNMTVNVKSSLNLEFKNDMNTDTVTRNLVTGYFCQNLRIAAVAGGTVVSCEAASTTPFSAGTPTTKTVGQMRLTVKLEGKSVAERLQILSTALVNGAATNSQWDLVASDITLVTASV